MHTWQILLTAYHILRVVLAVLGIPMLRYGGMLEWSAGRWMRRYFFAQLLWWAIPAFRTAWWQYGIQTPLIPSITLLSVAVTLHAIWTSDISQRERECLVAGSVALALACGAALWWYYPESWFHAVMIVRQYVSIGLAAGATFAYVYLELDAVWSNLTGWWVAWLWMLALLSMAGSDCLLWSVVPWQHNISAQYGVADAVLVMQGLLLFWLRNVHVAPLRGPNGLWLRVRWPDPHEQRTREAGQQAGDHLKCLPIVGAPFRHRDQHTGE